MQGFTGLDPLKNMYPGNSAYSYVFDNPIQLVDVKGKYIIVGGSHDDQSLIKMINSSFLENVVASTITNSEGKTFLKLRLSEGVSYSDLTKDQQFVYDNMREMIDSRTKRYLINVEETDGFNADLYRENEIYPENIDVNDPNSKLGSLWTIDHFLREQRIKQDEFMGGRPEEVGGNQQYLTDHERTLDEQLKGFGYTQGRRYDMLDENEDIKVIDVDIIDENGEYLSTVRFDQRGESVKRSEYTKTHSNEIEDQTVQEINKQHFKNNPE